MSDSEQRNRTAATSSGSNPDQVGDPKDQPRVSTSGHMDPDGPGELPSDRNGAGTAERNRDRHAGLGEGLPKEGADIPDSETIGGRESSTRAGRQILDAIQEREPHEGRE